MAEEQQWNRLYFDEWVAREGLDLIRGTHVETSTRCRSSPGRAPKGTPCRSCSTAPAR